MRLATLDSQRYCAASFHKDELRSHDADSLITQMLGYPPPFLPRRTSLLPNDASAAALSARLISTLMKQDLLTGRRCRASINQVPAKGIVAFGFAFLKVFEPGIFATLKHILLDLRSNL